MFGGSFDPPHLAHQMMCLYALSAAAVDEVWMLPAFAHAFGKPLSQFDDRVRMCELAAAPFGGRVVVSRVEEEVARARGAESRTVNTLIELRARHPAVALRLLIGEDILAERAAWHRWDDVVALAPLIVVGRMGAPAAAAAATSSSSASAASPATSSSASPAASSSSASAASPATSSSASPAASPSASPATSAAASPAASPAASSSAAASAASPAASGDDEPAVRLPAISSSDVRDRLRRGERPAVVPRAVLEHIAARGLYR